MWIYSSIIFISWTDVNKIKLCNYKYYKRYYKQIWKYVKIHLYINNKEIVKIYKHANVNRKKN